LSDISEYDTGIKSLLNRLKENAIDINDIVMDIHTINHNLNLDSNQLSLIEDRMNSINILEKKLNVSTIEEIESKIQLMKDELASLDSVESDINQLEKEKISIESKLFSLSDELTLLRKRSAFDLIDLLKIDLFNLGIDNPNIEFSFLKTENLLPHGTDRIELLFSSNKGYNPKPLLNVASGGEISRLMLCIKKSLFSVSPFSTIIFDEIDSGVSGEIGRKMGRILQNISTQGQVVCITHLPQIASLGSQHYKVLKEDVNNMTLTSIKKLNYNDRINEIARMLSGDEVNTEAIANAKKMIDI
jgi:DNA repair protein RecN (Recombination protein N)